LRAVARLLIGGLHLAVLVGILALCVSYGLTTLKSSKKLAVAKVVAPQMRIVAAPSDGQFQAARPFSKGEWVRAGEVLGVIQTRDIRDQLTAKCKRWRDLQREILLAAQASRDSASSADEQYLRQLRLDANATQAEVTRLEELQRDLIVKSPIEGRIWFGLSGSKEVRKYEEITPIWPSGGGLRIEIEAPREHIDEILRAGVVECRFPTPDGDVVTVARPVPATRQPLLAESNEHGSERRFFGRIECIPDTAAAQALLPGWIGSL
jgi:hypothetical protein